MKLLYNYILNHFFSLSFVIAFVFFAMDMSGILGTFGYDLYFPLLFVVCIYAIINKEKINYFYFPFLFACTLSVVGNIELIPDYFNITQRYLVFFVIIIGFSNMLTGRKIALVRLHTLHMFSILSVILVVVNYIFFSMGMLSEEQMEVYERAGLYTGSTANNEMGVLSAVSIMFITTYMVAKYKSLRLWELLLFVAALFCSTLMMGLASSRMGLLCSVVSVSAVLYKGVQNRKKLITILLGVGLFFYFSADFYQETFKFMLQKNGGNFTEVNTDSRDDMFLARLDEFKESPLCGIGFAYAKYGWGVDGAEETHGRIETGSGWLTVLSQTGMLGLLSIMLIIIPNIIYIYRKKSDDYCNIWISGLTVMFVLQPFTESYITTVGALFCCLFWLNWGVVDSFRQGYLVEDDLKLE